MAIITPTRFDWTDDALYTSGINFTYENLRDFFKSILVNGLGAKPALGWTIQFTEDVDKIVFRNPDNTFSMRVSTGSGTSTYSDWPDILFAEDFTDNDSYTNKFHHCCFDADQLFYPVCIGYETTFYLIMCDRTDSGAYTRSLGNNDWLTLFCGKYNTVSADVNPVFVTGGIYKRTSIGGGIYVSEPNYSTSVVNYSPIFVSDSIGVNAQLTAVGGIVIPFDQSGVFESVQPEYSSLFTHGLSMGSAWDVSEPDILSYQYLVTPLLKRSHSAGAGGLVSPPLFRGSLVGLDATFQQNNDATSRIFGEEYSLNGGQYVLTRNYNFYGMVRVDQWEIL